MFHCWSPSFNCYFDDGLIVFDDAQLRLTLRRTCLRRNLIHTQQINFFGRLLLMFGCALGFAPVFCELGATEVALLCVERNTYNIPQVESRGTVLLQTGIQRYDFRFCRNVWHWSLLFASLVYIYIYIYEINRAQRRSQAWLRWVTDRASLLTDHRMSGLPILARYNHFQTICEHTCDSSPIDSSSSFLKLWSFKQGPETFYKLLCLFVRQFAMSFHAFLSMSFHVVGRRHSFCVRLLSSW